MPDNYRDRRRIPRVLHPRAVWLETLRRIQRLEERQDETDRLLDAVFSDAAYEHGVAGLNGQRARKELVKALFDQLRFAMVVETGTHFGDTAGYLAREFDVPVHTCELTPRYFRVARHLLRELRDVHVHHLDSRALLRELAADRNVTSLLTFFYLDAHWHDDLPLAEELDLIARHWTQWVAVIDDFQVPHDAGYGFDDYGRGAQLTLDYIMPVLQGHRLPAYFPARRSEEDTGARRGCLVTAAPPLTSTLASSPLLRPSLIGPSESVDNKRRRTSNEP
jgi:predicted O-methyltransferase YrrM